MRERAGLSSAAEEDEKEHAKKQERQAEERSTPHGEIIYRAVRQDGDDTLLRSNAELAWSGLAAGLSMGLSLLAEGMLRMHLPDAAWTPLVSKLGYAIGFLVVVLGRQELFTEQTLNAILPLLSSDRDHGDVGNVARVWIVILVANLVGTAAFAAFTAFSGAFPPEAHSAFSHLGHAALSHGFMTTLARAVVAGFIIATMIWLLPAADSARFWIILSLAWLVGIAGLAHIVAGSAETLYVVFRGERTLTEWVIRFLLPSFLGNSIGGVGLVAALAHAQHAPAESK
jgi:formate/nitrite transporter FocA (FNT family)